MAWLASLPGRLLERIGNGAPRGMTVTRPGSPGCAQNPAYRATSHLIVWSIQKMPAGFSPVGIFLSARKFFVDNFVGFLHAAL